MCGIIGYVGKSKNAVPVLLNGLKCLEYRGYDSAGVAYLKGSEIEIVKSLGPIKNLDEKLKNHDESNLGIGHTRWATHGVPNETNSHPHRVGKVTIVHNGIIENYVNLKEKLSAKGYKFKSDTDTEVAAALINYLYDNSGDMISTIKEFKTMVKGSYAIVIILEDDRENLYVVKNLSPMIIGIGEGENYVASDVPAILPETKRYINLLDGEFAIVSKDKVSLYDSMANPKEIVIKEFSGDASDLDKGTYEHFMLKEIHEEPEVVKTLFNKYLVEKEFAKLPDLRKYKSVTIVACGSAMHAGLIGKHLIEKNLNIPVEVEIASEFRYKKLFLGKDDVVIAISQSGETADTLSAVKIANARGADTIGIVNVKESSIAREVKSVIYTLAGSEIAVATTKAYVAQIIILMLMSIKEKIRGDIVKTLMKTPLLMEKLINETDVYLEIAELIKDREDIFFIGRLIDYAICMEGSLKLKEISYIHSEAYAAGELKHGTISLINDGTPVFAVITDEDIAEKTVSNIKEVKARGAYVILIVSEKLNEIGDYYDKKIVIPSTISEMDAVMSVLPLQIISYEIAKLRGCSIDKPRNLAKSVTVE